MLWIPLFWDSKKVESSRNWKTDGGKKREVVENAEWVPCFYVIVVIAISTIKLIISLCMGKINWNRYFVPKGRRRWRTSRRIRIGQCRWGIFGTILRYHYILFPHRSWITLGYLLYFDERKCECNDPLLWSIYSTISINIAGAFQGRIYGRD